jgi:uncharacterized protein YlxP (DUF503 family)
LADLHRPVVATQLVQSSNRSIVKSPNRQIVVVALLTVELFIPGSHSLKEKRMVLRRIKDRIGKFNVAVSEVEHHELWQRGGLAIVTVATDQQHADRELAAVADEIERVEPGLITRTDVEFLT